MGALACGIFHSIRLEGAGRGGGRWGSFFPPVYSMFSICSIWIRLFRISRLFHFSHQNNTIIVYSVYYSIH